jgi:hypothetical protein
MNPPDRSAAMTPVGEHPLDKLERELADARVEIDYFRVRMMVAVSFLDSDTLDTFHEHVAEIDAKHREGTYGR